MSMRDEILRVATELYTYRGYRGVSFNDIAQVLGITTTNIHYHFKNKVGLAKEALELYALGVESAVAEIWTDQESSLQKKMKSSLELNRKSYYRFNKPGEEGKIWSLLTRFSNELDAFPENFRVRITHFRQKVHNSFRHGLEMAVERGEFRQEVLETDMSRLLAQCFLYAGYIARDGSSFQVVESHYRLVMDLLQRSYGAVDRAG